MVSQWRRGPLSRTTLVVAVVLLVSGAPAAACGHQPRTAAAADSVPAAMVTGARDDRSFATVPEGRNGPPAAGVSARSSTRGARQPTILFIGTSLTAGYGLPRSEAFPAVAGRMLDSAGHSAIIVNAGVSGETSAGARTRIDWVLRQPADVIVLETGANDGLRGLSVVAARDNIQAILDRIRVRQPSSRVLLVQMEAVPNLGAAYTTAFRAMYPELAKKNGVELVPFLLDGVAGLPSLNQDDGLHPNRAGAQRVARNIYAALIKRPLVTVATH